MAGASSRAELFRRKEELESEIGGLVSALEDEDKGPGLHGNLIADDGFPRADIDIYAVRNMRHRLAQLQTDHQEVMKQIEALLFSGAAFQGGSVATAPHGPCARPTAHIRPSTATHMAKSRLSRQVAAEPSRTARLLHGSSRSSQVRLAFPPTCHPRAIRPLPPPPSIPTQGPLLPRRA